GRINVWPTYAIAREADTEESKFVGQLTVWQTNSEARVNISHEEEGGGLDWVPDGAVIHIDLVGGSPQGRAWVEGTGVVAVAALLGSDANTENYWEATEYNPAYLGPDGYSEGAVNHPPAFIGALRDGILAGGTMRLQFSNNPSGNIVFMSTDGNAVIQIDMVTRDVQAYSNDALDIDQFDVFSSEAVNALAITLVSDRFDVAASGNAASTSGLTEGDRPAGNPLSAALVDLDTGVATQSITLYDPLPSTAGLS